ncbi:MAG: nucleotide pyrophosphohydrolase [Gemmatimonadetes bacterium]|nr:nucleotide pyrophosphohydrolase [Gemmatimonadota bacterium]
MQLHELQGEVVRFAEEREWGQFHDPKNLAMALASEAGELLALLRWVPTDRADEAARGDLRPSLADEIGDVGILLMLLCNRTGIDLGGAIAEKLHRNALRYPGEGVARSFRTTGE